MRGGSNPSWERNRTLGQHNPIGCLALSAGEIQGGLGLVLATLPSLPYSALKECIVSYTDSKLWYGYKNDNFNITYMRYELISNGTGAQ